MVTRLPDTGQTPPPSDTSRNLRPPSGDAVETPEARLRQLPAGRQLDLLQLKNREAVLARVAQILNARSGAPEQAVLEVRGRSLLIQPTIGETKLETGDWVKVMRAGNELMLMGKMAPTADARIAQALAQRLPWQSRLDTGLAELSTALKAAAAPQPAAMPGRTPLPAAVTEAIQQLMNQLPASRSFAGTRSTPAGESAIDRPEIMAGRIKTLIAESGLFTEGRIARSPELPLADLKLALGRIVAALLTQQGADSTGFNRYTPLVSHELVQAPLQFPNQLPPPPPTAGREPLEPGQLLRMLAGMLNRITVNQLHSQVLTNRATADGAAPATLLIELPWVTPQNEPRLAQLRIEHDRPDEADAENRKNPQVAEWRFSLAVDLDEAGPVFFEVALRQARVSARVWAEQQNTLRKVQDELGDLRRRLGELGLEVVDLECRRGSPQSAATRLEQRLVDIRA
ncbi:flagellar hook-length control protein FliK [Marinobacter sp.]|uniref:flagellar hook-length control protein FliK n=1 Tax=Marinobacter sp. TaxID=50741 RepID=UPI003850FF83